MDAEGLSSVVGVTLMVAIVVGLGAGVVVMMEDYSNSERPDRRVASFTIERGLYENEFRLIMIKGAAIPLAAGDIILEIDGVRTSESLTTFANHTRDGQNWTVGEELCIVGDDPHCRAAKDTVKHVKILIFVDDDTDPLFAGERNLR
ncbi:MAG: hypothetical protein ACPHID_03195 [Thermoplasmatota archaeon]